MRAAPLVAVGSTIWRPRPANKDLSVSGSILSASFLPSAHHIDHQGFLLVLFNGKFKFAGNCVRDSKLKETIAKDFS